MNEKYANHQTKTMKSNRLRPPFLIGISRATTLITLCLSVLLSSAVHADDFFKRKNEVWDAYLAELERLIGPSSDASLLQPLNVSHPFPADETNYPKFTKFLANQAANVVTDFGATSNNPILTASLLTDRYEDFLASLALTVSAPTMTPEEKALSKQLQTDVDDARQKLIAFDQAVDLQWFKYTQTHTIQPPEWLARQKWENYYQYEQERHDHRDSMSGAITAKWLFLMKVTPPAFQSLTKAQEYWRNTQYEEVFPPSTLYEAEPSHEHWGSHKSQTISMNYPDFFTNDSIRKLEISTTTNQSNTRKNHWNSEGGYSLGFISVKGGGGGSSEEAHIRSNIDKVEISWKRLEEYPVYRAPWFQPKLFTTYGATLKGFWGPGGRLSCYPTHVILSRGLTIKLYIKNEAKDDFKKAWSASGGISIGPWSVGGGGGGEETINNYKEETFGFTIEDSPATARMIAVRVERPNYKSVDPNDFDALLSQEFTLANKAIGGINGGGGISAPPTEAGKDKKP